MKAYQANALCVANTFRCKIPHVKASLRCSPTSRTRSCFPRRARTHTPAHSLDQGGRRRAHLALRRAIELLAFIRKERENLVLKPSDEYGGTGVTLGWETTEQAWDAAIEKAVSAVSAGGEAGCWIVQERIPIRREVFPYITQARGEQRRIQRHARRLRSIPLPRQIVRIPHPPKRHRTRQRHLGRRPSPRFPRNRPRRITRGIWRWFKPGLLIL